MNPVTLTWRLLTAEELTKVYLDEMRRDFPQSELKPLSMILNSEAAGTAHTWGIYDGDALAAYLLTIHFLTLDTGSSDGIKRVQRVSSGCCNKSTRILSRFPLAIITVIPSSATLRAILVFVNIPPRPKLDLVV